MDEGKTDLHLEKAKQQLDDFSKEEKLGYRAEIMTSSEKKN